ncbi:hypothetical protein MGWOODY_Smn1099 [hydrothermal vent metagenome]|uniref:Uncharacterized protein n=1 Tax=hydrothermal vent metagenome TaxID=652676 RepID=A0A170PNA1_9ZZZZ
MPEEESHCDEDEAGPRRRLSGERPGLLLIGPALFVLSASPVQAAGPGQHLVELCTAEGISWIALPDTGRFPPEDPAKANSHAACAHVLRPRAVLRPHRNRAET